MAENNFLEIVCPKIPRDIRANLEHQQFSGTARESTEERVEVQIQSPISIIYLVRRGNDLPMGILRKSSGREVSNLLGYMLCVFFRAAYNRAEHQQFSGEVVEADI